MLIDILSQLCFVCKQVVRRFFLFSQKFQLSLGFSQLSLKYHQTITQLSPTITQIHNYHLENEKEKKPGGTEVAVNNSIPLNKPCVSCIGYPKKQLCL